MSETELILSKALDIAVQESVMRDKEKYKEYLLEKAKYILAHEAMEVTND